MRKKIAVAVILAGALAAPLSALSPAHAAPASCTEKASVVYQTLTITTPKFFGKSLTVDLTNPYQIKVPVSLDPSCATAGLYCPSSCRVEGKVTASSTSGDAGGKVWFQKVGYIILQYTPYWYDYSAPNGCSIGSASTTNQHCSKVSVTYVTAGTYRTFCEWNRKSRSFVYVDRGAKIVCEFTMTIT